MGHPQRGLEREGACTISAQPPSGGPGRGRPNGKGRAAHKGAWGGGVARSVRAACRAARGGKRERWGREGGSVAA